MMQYKLTEKKILTTSLEFFSDYFYNVKIRESATTMQVEKNCAWNVLMRDGAAHYESIKRNNKEKKIGRDSLDIP